MCLSTSIEADISAGMTRSAPIDDHEVESVEYPEMLENLGRCDVAEKGRAPVRLGPPDIVGVEIEHDMGDVHAPQRPRELTAGDSEPCDDHMVTLLPSVDQGIVSRSYIQQLREHADTAGSRREVWPHEHEERRDQHRQDRGGVQVG